MKRIILFAAMMAVTLCAGAQARHEAKKFTLQPFLGGTGATMTNTPDMRVSDQWSRETVEGTSTGGGIIGLEAEYIATERIGVALGVNYAEAGTGWDSYKLYDENYVEYNVRETAWKTGYVNVPLTVNWYVRKGLALKTGFQLGFLTRGKEYMRTEYTTDGVDYTLEAEQDCKGEFSKFDLAFPIGLSYEFKFPLVIDFRFNIGVCKVNKNSLGGKNLYNRLATLTLGYKFRL